VSSPSPWGVRVRIISLCDGCPPLSFIDARGRGIKGIQVKSTVLHCWDVFLHVVVRQGALKGGWTVLALRPPCGRAGLFIPDTWHFLWVLLCRLRPAWVRDESATFEPKRRQALIIRGTRVPLAELACCKVWRPRFLITIINTNGRISRVKPAEHRSNLGQPGSSPRRPRQWTLLDPLTKSTHIGGQPLVQDTVKPGLTVDVSECRPELLPRSPKFT
jgi:hypothetical protein